MTHNEERKAEYYKALIKKRFNYEGHLLPINFLTSFPNNWEFSSIPYGSCFDMLIP
jgi:hypothetical protein